MRCTFKLFGRLAMFICMATANAAPSVEDVANRLIARDSLLVAELANIAPAELDSLLRDVWGATIDEHPDAAKRAYELLAGAPGIERLYREGTINIPHLKENGRERGRRMGMLARFRTRWALNLLGELLNDPRPLTTRYNAEELKLYELDLVAAYSKVMSGMQKACKRSFVRSSLDYTATQSRLALLFLPLNCPFTGTCRRHLARTEVAKATEEEVTKSSVSSEPSVRIHLVELMPARKDVWHAKAVMPDMQKVICSHKP